MKPPKLSDVECQGGCGETPFLQEEDLLQLLVKDLPALPAPSRCALYCQMIIGLTVVSGIIGFCWVLYEIVADVIEDPVWIQRMRMLMRLEGCAAWLCVFALQQIGMHVRRSQAACFPLPAVVAERLQNELASGHSLTVGLKRAVNGMGNVAEDHGRVYCVR